MEVLNLVFDFIFGFFAGIAFLLIFAFMNRTSISVESDKKVIVWLDAYNQKAVFITKVDDGVDLFFSSNDSYFTFKFSDEEFIKFKDAINSFIGDENE